MRGLKKTINGLSFDNWTYEHLTHTRCSSALRD